MNDNDEVLAIFADLLSSPEYEDLLSRFFVGQKNTWHSLKEICEPSEGLRRRLDSLIQNRSSEPKVVWLDDSLALEREGYCVVICYWDEAGIESVATYNKAALARRSEARKARIALMP